MMIGVNDFAALLGGDLVFARFLRRMQIWQSRDYAAFITLLYEDLDAIIYSFQANPQTRNGDSEDRITEEFVSNLTSNGYIASHDTSSGGHVDLTVKLNNLSWIGEAKKNQKFDEGFKQLVDRYKPASGNYAHNNAGLLLYLTEGTDTATQLERWKAKLPEVEFKPGEKYRDLTVEPCTASSHAFFSTHTHNTSGLPFIVRHMTVTLQFSPTDSSARQVATRRKKKDSVDNDLAGSKTPLATTPTKRTKPLKKKI